MSLKSVPFGTAYAIWTGIGAAGAVIAGIVLFGEAADWMRVGCLLLIVAGTIGLPQFQKEELLASLLIFRCLYFVFPLFLVAILLGVREAWMTAVAVTRQDS